MRSVFISSTFKDLIPHRTAVIDAVNSLDGFSAMAMEEFGARDADAGAFCTRRVRDCDIFVGILGHCYGTVDSESVKSFTELEFEAAASLNKPRLVFMLREDAPIQIHLVEPDELRKRQATFRQASATERIRDTFTTPDDLAIRVTRALRNWEQGSS